jgi:ribonucleotide monophosphatase NagD (HAD superfamily)
MADTSKSFQTHTSFAELVDSYDGFILDQFGVMHNGHDGLQGAPECVALLSQKGKKLIILSNSSSLSSATVKKLPKLGYNPDHFVGAVTSGQEASHYIKKKFDGKKALFITWQSGNVSSPMVFVKDCGEIEITDNADEADFVLLHGAEVLRGPGEDGEATETSLGTFSETGDFSVMDPVLEKCASRKLPMVCCNPDYVMVKPDGTRAHMPGTWLHIFISARLFCVTHSQYQSPPSQYGY